MEKSNHTSSRLRFESEAAAEAPKLSTPKKPGKRPESTPSAESAKRAASKTVTSSVPLQFEEKQSKHPSPLKHSVTSSVITAAHQKIAAANEDDNTAVTAVNNSAQVAGTVSRKAHDVRYAHKLKAHRRSQRTDRSPITVTAGSFHDADFQSNGNRDAQSLNLSHTFQKTKLKRKYAIEKATYDAQYVTATVEKTSNISLQTTKNTFGLAKKAGRTVVSTVKSAASSPYALTVFVLLAMLIVVMSSLQACTPLAQSVLESIVIGTYPAEEQDVRAAEHAYVAKEKDLKYQLDHYASLHPEYDACVIDADNIWHDPYVLIAIISAYYDGEQWDIDKAVPVIEKYFDLQYVLTETVDTEIRYQTETRTGTRVITDSSTGQQHTESYSYTVRVPYTYKTMHVRLENKNLSHLPVVSMSHHTMGMYALYMATHGNMEGIFSGNAYATPLRDPYIYNIPQETLDADPMFAILMDEANKYIGYPYVWGGASPETSFDCSGFVSYVFTNSGVYNTGRLGATGLYNLCHRVTADEVKPGDIVFFEGTIDGADGITHCGIYVGGSYMIHCGSPIGYADLNDSYWRRHFHSYGRVPN